MISLTTVNSAKRIPLSLLSWRKRLDLNRGETTLCDRKDRNASFLCFQSPSFREMAVRRMSEQNGDCNDRPPRFVPACKWLIITGSRALGEQEPAMYEQPAVPVQFSVRLKNCRRSSGDSPRPFGFRRPLSRTNISKIDHQERGHLIQNQNNRRQYYRILAMNNSNICMNTFLSIPNSQKRERDSKKELEQKKPKNY